MLTGRCSDNAVMRSDEQPPGAFSAEQDAEPTVATAVQSAPTESAEATETGTTAPGGDHNAPAASSGSAFYEPSGTLEPPTVEPPTATGAEGNSIPPEALLYPVAPP